MQTFLPYPDFLKSAKVLDKKRCWKQVVEAKQIINILEKKQFLLDNENPDFAKQALKTISWGNHPAVKMWEGHIDSLQYYFNCFLDVCLIKHKIKTSYLPFDPSMDYLLGNDENENIWWMGNKNFHRAMRARLIEKDREFYLPLFPEDEGFNNGKYFWPDMGTKTFKVI